VLVPQAGVPVGGSVADAPTVPQSDAYECTLDGNTRGLRAQDAGGPGAHVTPGNGYQINHGNRDAYLASPRPAMTAAPALSSVASAPVDLQTGKTGVDYAVQLNELRTQNQLERTAARHVAGRNCVQVGAAWVDDGFDSKMKTVTVKAQSAAYFRILERHPEVK